MPGIERPALCAHNNKSVAIGIPTYNRGHILLQTINQVLSQDPAANEIIVVDQSDWYAEGAREQLETFIKKGAIRYYTQVTPNLPMARNRILSETNSDIVIFVDDDVQLASGFVAAHASNYISTDIWAVCGRVTDEGVKPSPWRPRNWPKTNDYRHFDLSWQRRVEDFGSLKGCNHSVHRLHALELGGYDIGYQGVALREETDFALRLLSAGGRIVFDPSAALHHLRAPAGGCRVGQWGDWSAGMCSLRFALKHQGQLQRGFIYEVWHAYRLGVLNRRLGRKPLDLVKRNCRFIMICLASIIAIMSKKLIS